MHLNMVQLSLLIILHHSLLTEMFDKTTETTKLWILCREVLFLLSNLSIIRSLHHLKYQ